MSLGKYKMFSLKDKHEKQEEDRIKAEAKAKKDEVKEVKRVVIKSKTKKK